MRRHGSERGAALIIVLAVVALITGIVVSLVVGMRTEERSSYYYMQRQQAELMAQEGTTYGQALLQGALGATNQSWWISMPGSLVFLTATNGTAASVTNVALSTGAGDTNQAGAFAPANLNPASWLDQDRMIDPQGTNMYLNWIYVRTNGDLETNQAPSALTNDPVPLLGRFAFWIDDESTHVDLNTAWGQAGNTNVSSHPSQVNLTAITNLTQAMADAIHNKAAARPFNTPYEALSASSNAASVLSSNRFALTHYTHDSDLTPWGAPKIVLTTQASNTVSTNQPYLNILKTPNGDPGSMSQVDPVGLQNTLSNIVAQLSQTNWPYVSGNATLIGKYYPPGTTDRQWQLAVDIVDYVRSKESTNTAIEPILGMTNAPTVGFTSGNLNGDRFQGMGRHPLIVQMAMVMQRAAGPLAATNIYKGTVYCGMWLPLSMGNTAAMTAFMNTCTVFVQYQYIGVSPGTNQTTLPCAGSAPIFESTNNGGVFYQVHKNSIPITNIFPTAADAFDPTNVIMKLVLEGTSGSPSYDLAPIRNGPTLSAVVPVMESTISGVLPTNSALVYDPRINKQQANWIIGKTSWTNLPAATLTNVIPQQDRVGGGASATLYTNITMPWPKGTASNQFGLVNSVGELGYLSTGVEATTNAARVGIPFRTWRFQPTPGATAATVPDWALADIFTVPVATNGGTLYHPYTNAVAGRVNLNTAFLPFPDLNRTNSLNAAFIGATNGAFTNLPPANVSSLVANIAARALSPNGGVAYGSTNGFSSIGQLAEIQGVSDGGEASEDVFRDLTAQPVTTRGDVFTIYSVGQALKQTPGGSLIVTGQKLTRTMIERYPTNVISGGVTNTVGKFRVLYWRED